MKSIQSRPAGQSNRRLFGRLRSDERGVAAVEFAFIAPILMVMLVGVIEATRAVSIDRRLGQVTSMVGDLVAREENMTAADLNAIYGIVDHVMGVWGAEPLRMEVIPVVAAMNNPSQRRIYAEATNRPAFGTGGSVRPHCQDYTNLSEDLLAAGDSVIVVESEYQFRPILAGNMFPESTWRDRAVLKPRHRCVDFDDNECISTCFN